MTINPLLLASATRLARLIRDGEVSSREAVDAHIAHIERVNPKINAVVKDRFLEARREADEADALTRATRAGGAPSPLPPFHGVPCTIKEAFALRGMPNSSGLVSRKSIVSESDATGVARLRAAGAIPLGVTNVSELCMWMESNNRVYGRTSNPYDVRRTAGGSSGGEGAIVGSGASPFGLGSDVGGSIRMPAFFNGVFGHKPSGGLVPGTGQYPLAHGPALRYLSTGPIARRAEDLMPLLRLLAGPDGVDTGCEPILLGAPEAVELSGLKVLDVRENGFVAVSADLQDAQDRAARALERRGARVERASFAELASSLEIWSSMMGSAGGPSFAELLGDGAPLSPMRELGRLILGRSHHTLPGVGLALIEKVTALAPARTRAFVEQGLAFRARLSEALGPDGIMLYPSYTRPAPRHHTALVPPVHWVYAAILNVLELPVTQVPLGLNGAGLPLGVQVVGSHGKDHITIAVALELERAFGGWVPPAMMS
jgi:fatty acid amide hydrolase 2